METKTTFLSLLLTVCCLICIWTGCQGNKEKNTAPDFLKYDSTTIELTGEHTTFKAHLEAPTDTVSEFARIIWNEVFLMSTTSMGDYDSTQTVNFDLRKLGETIGNRFIHESDTEINSFTKESGENENPYLQYSNEFAIRFVANTKKYITLEYKGYIYTGGAHGMSSHHATTISVDDHKIMKTDDIFLKNNRDSLLKIVKAEILRQHYRGNTQPTLLFSITDLPVNTPHFLIDGMRFIYSLYEIDAYSSGMPSCIIPYQRLLPFMTEEARRLIAQ